MMFLFFLFLFGHDEGDDVLIKVYGMLHKYLPLTTLPLLLPTPTTHHPTYGTVYE